MPKIYAIDPGNIKTALCIIDLDTLRPLHAEKSENEEIYQLLRNELYAEDDVVVIEDMISYGMSVGRSVFDTLKFIGHIEELMRYRNPKVGYVFRTEEKLHICGTVRAKDTNIRAALIERFAKHDLKNGKGTKQNPDWFHGFSADMWAAYAVGLTYIETKMEKE